MLQRHQKMSTDTNEEKHKISCVKSYLSQKNEYCCFKCVRIRGKGLGIVAMRDIKMGDIILRERPILSWKSYESLRFQFNKLSNLERDAVLNLSNSPNEFDDGLKGIVDTNAFYCESNDCLCLFLRASRFNHSCIPNLQPIFRNSKLSLYASCDISKDEELCISYLPLWQSPNTLKQILREKYCFECSCELCLMEDQGQLKKILSYRCRYGKIMSSVSKKLYNGGKINLHLIMQIFETLKKAKLWFPHLILAHSIDGFEIAMSNNNTEKAKQFLKIAYQANQIVFGKHCLSNKPFQEFIKSLNDDAPKNCQHSALEKFT